MTKEAAEFTGNIEFIRYDHHCLGHGVTSQDARILLPQECWGNDMAEHLTDLKVKNLCPGAARREIPDGRIGGLYFVLQPSGARSWAVRYRAGGRPAKFTIGAYPAIDLATARRLAQKALGEVAEGQSPAANKQAAKAALREAKRAENDLVERVVEQFVERHAKPKTRDWRETERMLKNKIVKAWRGRRLSQIGRADVHALLDNIIDVGHPISANRTFAQLRKMCGWAVERGILNQNPCQGMRAPSVEKARDRVLSDTEIRLAWRALERVGWPFGPMAKMLLLTGARRNEVAEMSWGEVDLDKRSWTLPETRSKTRRAQEIPLSDAAIVVLKSVPRIGEAPIDYVFTTTGRTPISGFSRAKSQIDAAIIEIMRAESVTPLEPWTLHDLRRTVATNLQRLGIKLEVTESVLGHISGSRAGVVGIYQRHDFADEKRAALDVWSRKLDQIVTGKLSTNVVDLVKARG
jgi:integrase